MWAVLNVPKCIYDSAPSCQLGCTPEHSALLHIKSRSAFLFNSIL